MAKVLVVDNSPDLLDLFSTLLTYRGHKVKGLLTGDVDETISSFEPDMIFLDVVLIGEDGRAICKKIKEKNKALPIVLISANPAVLRDFEECKADAVVEKPFDLKTVITTVDNLLQKALAY